MAISYPTHEAIWACALRFDGWKYVERRGDQDILATLNQRFVQTLRMSEDENENHAAFFALQRWLFKWGGDRTPATAREHAAYLLLFLHLYRADIEPSLRNAEYWRKWHVEYASRADDIAAKVRLHVVRTRWKPLSSDPSRR